MREYRPKWQDGYKWAYAIGLIKNYDKLVDELHDMESRRLGYAGPREVSIRSGTFSDPTYRQAFPEPPSAYETALAKRVEAVEQSFLLFDELEQRVLKAHIVDGYTYEQLVLQGYPFSVRTMARKKSRLIQSIADRLYL